MLDAIKCVSRHVEDLADGRLVAPGEIASDVDLSEPYNKQKLDEGKFIKIGAEQQAVAVPPDESDSNKEGKK